MLVRGQRNLRMERHSLILWGLAGAGLLLSSDVVFTAEQIPDTTRRALVWLAYIALVLGGAGYADWHLTRRVKAARDETWSFIHRQVVKLLWLLMGIGTLFTFATFFFGGAYMLCTVWLVLIGLALYVHGLFSEEVLEWAGGIIIAIGVAGLAARPFETMKWIATSVFGLGLPMLSGLLDHGRERPFVLRLVQAAGGPCWYWPRPLPVIATRQACCRPRCRSRPWKPIVPAPIWPGRASSACPRAPACRCGSRCRATCSARPPMRSCP
jgi:hypothetical protein